MKDEISEIIEDEEKSEKLNKLIEKKVEEKIESKLKQRKKKQEIIEKEKHVSRRSFMKKLGAGALGLGALSISPVSAYDIKSSHGLEVWSEGNQHMEVQNGNIDLMENNLIGVNNIKTNQLNGQNVDNLGSPWSDLNTNGTYQLPENTDGIDVATVSASDELKIPTYPTLGDVPTTLPEGAQVYVQDERIYVEDGT